MYIKDVRGFNPGGAGRRNWQSGDGLYGNSIFWMTVPMFIRRPEGLKKPAAPGHLHPWVVQAEKRSRRYMANPARPVVRALESGRLRDISQCTPNSLGQGDAVAVRFTVTYVEGDKDWYPQYLVSDVVRVACSPRVLSGDMGLYVKPDIPSSETQLEEGEIIDGE